MTPIQSFILAVLSLPAAASLFAWLSGDSYDRSRRRDENRKPPHMRRRADR